MANKTISQVRICYPNILLTFSSMPISLTLTAKHALLRHINSLRSFRSYTTHCKLLQSIAHLNLNRLLIRLCQRLSINEHVRCVFSEIPAFLSESETTRLLDLAENGRLESSDVFHNSMDTLLSQNSFEYWDLNRDDVINTDEVYILVMQRFQVIYHGLASESLLLSRYTHEPSGECVYQENTNDKWDIS